MGFTFTVTQVMVIRELLVIFLGNELSIAIVLSNWLLLEAAGSFFLGRRLKAFAAATGYALSQLLIALLLPLTLYGIRCLRDMMGLSIGEGASLLQIFFWTAVVLAPLGIVAGVLFTLACALHADFSDAPSLSLGKVYFYEGLGAGVGGILYTFLFIPLLKAFEVALLLGIANLLCGIFLLSIAREKGPSRHVTAGLLWSFLIAGVALLTLSGAGTWEKASLDRQWTGLQVLASRWSPYGNVTVGRREDQLTFFSNGIPACTVPVPNIAFAEELVHYPLVLHPSPKTILLIGGGPGGVLAEILKHPVDEVHYTETDPVMIRVLREHLAPLTRRELEHPLVRVHALDGRLFVKTTGHTFDAVLLNLPSPTTLELNRFYTVEFFTEISRLLGDRGVLALPLPGSGTYLSQELRNLNLCILLSLKQVFPAVQVIPGEVHLLLAFTSPVPWPPSAGTLIDRLRERHIPTQFFLAPQIQLKLEPHRLKWLDDSLKRGGTVELNRDAHPFGLYYGIAYWNTRFHPFMQVFWHRVAGLRLWHLAAPLLILIGAALALGRKRPLNGQRGILVWVVGSTGFFGMASNILLLFAFQTLLGYAYHWTGFLIASFMAGLAWGSLIMNRKLAEVRNPAATLAAIESCIVLFTLLLMTLLAFSYAFAQDQDILSVTQYGFIPASAGAGFLVGLEFPLAGRLYASGGEAVARTAGTLYAADLVGAFLGSLLLGVVLVPALGILKTLAVILLLKTASWTFTRLANRSSPSL